MNNFQKFKYTKYTRQPSVNITRQPLGQTQVEGIGQDILAFTDGGAGGGAGQQFLVWGPTVHGPRWTDRLLHTSWTKSHTHTHTKMRTLPYLTFRTIRNMKVFLEVNLLWN